MSADPGPDYDYDGALLEKLQGLLLEWVKLAELARLLAGYVFVRRQWGIRRSFDALALTNKTKNSAECLVYDGSTPHAEIHRSTPWVIEKEQFFGWVAIGLSAPLRPGESVSLFPEWLPAAGRAPAGKISRYVGFRIGAMHEDSMAPWDGCEYNYGSQPTTTDYICSSRGVCHLTSNVDPCINHAFYMPQLHRIDIKNNGSQVEICTHTKDETSRNLLDMSFHSTEAHRCVPVVMLRAAPAAYMRLRLHVHDTAACPKVPEGKPEAAAPPAAGASSSAGAPPSAAAPPTAAAPPSATASPWGEPGAAPWAAGRRAAPWAAGLRAARGRRPARAP